MSHDTHTIVDDDSLFEIELESRNIYYCGENDPPILVHGDHNCERFTFVMPRNIEGHDMSLCDVVEIHYLNLGTKGERSSDIYKVTDLKIDESNVNEIGFSWLISQNTTKHAGTLNFMVRLACTTAGKIEYVWNSRSYNGIIVADSINNEALVVEQYSDVLNQWYMDLILAGTTSVNAVKDAQNEVIEEINKVALPAQEAVANAEAAARVAQEAASSAEQAANTALSSIVDAKEAAISDIETTRDSVVEKANEALGIIDSASNTATDAAEQASEYASEAATASSNAASSAESAEVARTKASGFSNSASQSANSASQSANKALEHANAASQSAASAQDVATLVSDTFNRFYKVGTVYISFIDESPASVVGGDWEPILDRFLLAHGPIYNTPCDFETRDEDTGELLGTGGSATVTLLSSQLPAHSHAIATELQTSNVYIGSANTGGNSNGTFITGSSVFDKTAVIPANQNGRFVAVDVVSTNPLTYYEPRGEAHDNMPPYATVYMWRRIA